MTNTSLAESLAAKTRSNLVSVDGDLTATVMSVLQGIRATRSDGLCYDLHSNLTDAGFTSVEMVRVMLGIEAAFDIMIPQDLITPENFTSAATIASMVATLVTLN